MTRTHYAIMAIEELQALPGNRPGSPVNTIAMGIAMLYRNVTEDVHQLQSRIIDLTYQHQPRLRAYEVVQTIEQRHMHTDRQTVIETVSKITGIAVDKILSKSRVRTVSDARKFCYKYFREHMGLDLEEVASIMNRTHSAILIGIRRMNDLIEISDKQTISQWQRIVETIEQQK